MAKDLRASQLQTTQIISSGSSSTNAKIVFYDVSGQSTSNPNQGIIDPVKFSTSSIGSDIFLYVSGGIGGRNAVGGNIAAFGGDVYVSGNLFNNGIFTSNQISGSLSRTSDGSPYIITSGSIVVATNSNGQIELSGSFYPAITLKSEATTIRTASNDDDGALVRCTHVSGVNVFYITGTMDVGVTTEYVQVNTGSVTINTSSGMVLRVPSTFTPNTAEQYSSVVVTVIGTNEILLRGDLQAV